MPQRYFKGLRWEAAPVYLAMDLTRIGTVHAWAFEKV
jgi:hypothetical protein